jgi:hypothetical protein
LWVKNNITEMRGSAMRRHYITRWAKNDFIRILNHFYYFIRIRFKLYSKLFMLIGLLDLLEIIVYMTHEKISSQFLTITWLLNGVYMFIIYVPNKLKFCKLYFWHIFINFYLKFSKWKRIMKW